MSAKFTQGEWCVGYFSGEVNPSFGKQWPNVPVHVGNQKNKGNAICIVYMGGEGATRQDKEAIEANAKLIATAPELVEALVYLNAYMNDLQKSNPGYLGKLCLQDYAQLNEAFIKTESVLSKLGFDPQSTKAAIQLATE